MVGDSLPLLVGGLEYCGLTLNPHKCELFHRDAHTQEWARKMRLQSEGTVLLGAAIGTEEFVTEHYVEQAQGDQDLLRSIRVMHSRQCAFLPLSKCANHRLSNIIRLSPPEVTADTSAIHDRAMEHTLVDLLGSASLSEDIRGQAQLKISNGGIGTTSMLKQFADEPCYSEA